MSKATTTMEKFEMTELNLILLPEPQLEFKYGQTLVYPRDGLFLYGPVDGGRPEIHYGAIGTVAGVDLRVAYSHLTPLASATAKLRDVTDRLGLEQGADLMRIYATLMEEIGNAFEKLADIVKTSASTSFGC